jgi:methoxymalonate biosynthesis protein
MSDKPVLVKCLVWDLDNTLWQGTLTEDIEVRIREEVRAAITTLDSRGILQSISSKNDYDAAWRRLEELDLAQYFLLPQIGWGRKSDAVREIADQLQFAYDTIAFLDDSPAERAEVTYHLPQVRCYPAEDAGSLTALPEFSPAVVTTDSKRRREMYQASFRRDAERTSFSGPDADFLRSLELVLRIGRATEDSLSRLEELTARTSQMNATGVRYSDDVLRALLADPGHEVLVATMADRFGPYGAIGMLLLEMHEQVWHLKLLVTSCRVISFGTGTVILNWLGDQAALSNVHLTADFRPTGRNRMMEVAYRFAGYSDEDCSCMAGIMKPAGQDEIQCLHLVPARQAAPTTMRLVAPDLLNGFHAQRAQTADHFS